MKLALTRIAFTFVALCAAGPSFAAEPVRQDLFTAGENGYAMYRIPGILVTAKGSILVYCEARRAGGDWGDIDLLMRRSTDGGKTFSAPAPIGSRPKDAARNPAAVARKQGKEGAITMNNPVMFAAKDGAVHLLYCIEYGRVFYCRSDDDGQTFGASTEITSVFDKLRSEYDWKVIATGPGHGIQLSTGRLLVPVWLSLGTEGNAHKPSRVTTVYSDDAGKTWHAGALVTAAKDPVAPDASETNAVELSDGRVMLNLRHTGATHFRAVTTGPDGAGNWSPLKHDNALPEPICFASLQRYGGGKAGSGKNIILFSNPHNPTDRKRHNLAIKLSEDDGKTWPVMKVLEPGLAAYSDLAVGADGKIHCFFERGVDGKSYARLTLATLDLEWLK